jgi:N-methylhydantoinase A
MEADGRRLLETSGVPPAQISYRREADLRYVGQGHEIRVPLPDGWLDHTSIPAITASFEEVYRRLYERLSQSVPLEIINWRITVSGPVPEVRLQMPGTESEADQAVRKDLACKGSRSVYFPGGFRDVAVYDRYRLLPGMHLTGPAIVEERESTIVVGPESCFYIDEQWNLIIEL